MKILKLKQIEEKTLFYKKNILIKKLMLIPKKQILIYKLFDEKRKNQLIYVYQYFTMKNRIY